jgi:hypothetical protein
MSRSTATQAGAGADPQSALSTRGIRRDAPVEVEDWTSFQVGRRRRPSRWLATDHQPMSAPPSLSGWARA